MTAVAALIWACQYRRTIPPIHSLYSLSFMTSIVYHNSVLDDAELHSHSSCNSNLFFHLKSGLNIIGEFIIQFRNRLPTIIALAIFTHIRVW